MSTLIRTEWYRGTRSWRFWTTAALVAGVFAYTILAYANPWVGPGAGPPQNASIPNYWNIFSVLILMFQGLAGGYWCLFLPLFAALPAGDSLAVDRRRGVDAAIITRLGWARYLWGKWVGAALVSVGAIALAVAVTAGLALLVYPTRLPKFLAWKMPPFSQFVKMGPGVIGNQYVAMSAHFFWAHPGLYVAVVIGVALWATATLSGLAVAAGVWVRLPLVTLAVPLAICWAINEFPGVSQTWTPFYYAGQFLYGATTSIRLSWAGIVGYWAIPAALVAVVLAVVAHRGREWPVWTLGS